MDKAHRDKISRSLKGRKRSQATKDRISRSMRGKSNFEGKHHDRATKRELRRERGHDDRVDGRRWRTDKSTNDESRTYTKGDSSRYRWGRALSEWLDGYLGEDHGSGPAFYVTIAQQPNIHVTAEYNLSDSGWSPSYIEGSRTRPTLPLLPRGMNRHHAVAELRRQLPNWTVDGPFQDMTAVRAGEKLEELSTELLARYKNAAAADASKSDARGDYRRGDRRFRGLNRATIKQLDNDIRAREQGK